jgi:DNA repair protein RadC
MDRVDQVDSRPREKAKAKGVAFLSDTELLQLMIGSGTGKETVSKIARRTGRLLKRYGSDVTYEQLSMLKGLGPARVSQLLAMFELASRYPVDNRRLPLRSDDMKHQQLLKEKLTPQELGYATLDGAGRLIRHRKQRNTNTFIDVTIRSICADAVADGAAHLVVGRFLPDRLLIPTLADLSAAKNVAAIGAVLGFSVGYIIYNEKDWHSVTKDVSHVEH